MKAVLEFSLPEDKLDFQLASTATSWAFAIDDVDKQLRDWLKYGHDFKTADDAMDAVRRLIREALEERGVSLEWIY